MPCSQAPDQWSAGLGALVLSYFGLTDPCVANDHLSQLGPGVHNYTTAPFRRATTLAGPIGATLYASANTTDTEWVVEVSDVARGGKSHALTEGLLEGDQRALDPALSWYGQGHLPLLPYHPYTKAAKRPVKRGAMTRYEIEVFPTLDTLARGHRLRVTIETADFPHALPTVVQTPHLLLGVYELAHSAARPSSLELPLIPGTRGLRPIPRSPLP